ncbi:MAG: hypothetical protein SFU99_20660 [Saprospiraceae bacterium]|nr:hypothetical protein [Saprospiraceae bacterium]
MQKTENFKQKADRIRWQNWEYWSAKAFYFPMYVVGPLLALRSRHPAFFTTANPGIFTGGFGFESKYETILKIPEQYRPKTAFAKETDDFETVLKKIQQAGISFPLIAKPDLGFRGFLVRKIDSESELQAYLDNYKTDFIIQEFVWRAGEFGILYHRFPGKTKGKITSVTLKEFLGITGDGHSTVLELVQRSPRALLQIDRLRDTYSDLLLSVPKAGERISLGVIGNHSKGTRFISGNHLIDNELETTFDKIADQIPGFNYGRFDIKCDSWESLKQGKNITILEINGVCSEPTHIYDPERMTYFGALREIVRHWILIERIGRANRRLGAAYVPTFKMIRIIREGLKKVRRLQRLAAP